MGMSPKIGNFVIVSFSILSKTPVKIKVLPSFTLIDPESSLLVFKRSIVAQPSINLCSDFEDIAGDSVKVTKPLSSIFKILAPKVSPAIPYSNVAAPVSDQPTIHRNLSTNHYKSFITI